METIEKNTDTLESILTEWENDSKIDLTEPSREILRIPLLHAKYLRILSKARIASKTAHFNYCKLKKIKWEYYSGKLPTEELEQYGWEPFRYTLKSDISIYIEADRDIISQLNRKAILDELIEVCTAIMKELANRTYQLREHMAHERFIGGSR